MYQQTDVEICFYHKNCIDGTMSAALLREYKDKSIVFIALSHGTSVENALSSAFSKYDIKNIYKIWFLDIAPKKDDLSYLKSLNTEVIIIDHHKTTAQLISEFTGKPIEEDKPIRIDYDFISFIYDPLESGASLTYKTITNNDQIPAIIDIVKDKDLWLWRYENTDEINDFLYMYTNNPEQMREFLHKDLQEIASQSKVLSQYKNFNVARLKESWLSAPLYVEIKDTSTSLPRSTSMPQSITIPAVNTPVYQSEIGNLIAKEYGLACMFYITGNFVKLSFRSEQPKLDELGLKINARSVAESLGGGGHDHAAGAIMDINTFFGLLKTIE
jgi:oligoribonuclease NrnB/cAMP/cGMP phosphodiesterase (DHH superfamily)